MIRRLVRLGSLAVFGLLASACVASQPDGSPAVASLGVVTSSDVAPIAPTGASSSPSDAPDVDTPDEDQTSASPNATPSAAPSAPPASGDAVQGMTGSWTGTWQNDPQWGDANGGFTMELTQDGTRFTGPIDITGPTCVHHGESAGTIANGHVSWGIVAAGARDVDFEGVLAGDELAGTWTMTACGTSLTISGSWAAER